MVGDRSSLPSFKQKGLARVSKPGKDSGGLRAPGPALQGSLPGFRHGRGEGWRTLPPPSASPQVSCPGASSLKPPPTSLSSVCVAIKWMTPAASGRGSQPGPELCPFPLCSSEALGENRGSTPRPSSGLIRFGCCSTSRSGRVAEYPPSRTWVGDTHSADSSLSSVRFLWQ